MELVKPESLLVGTRIGGGELRRFFRQSESLLRRGCFRGGVFGVMANRRREVIWFRNRKLYDRRRDGSARD